MGVLVREDELLRGPDGAVIANGWMSVPASAPFSRLIHDRRPSDTTERPLKWARLGRGFMLTRLAFRPDEGVRASGDDLESYFY